MKALIQDTLKRFKIKLHRLTIEEYGISLEYDLQKIFYQFQNKYSPIVVFDVGANIGQSIDFFRLLPGNKYIHAFEPSPQAFGKLHKKLTNCDGITLNNLGLGADSSVIPFYENSISDISSFLKPSDKLWGNVSNVINVQVETLDAYCAKSKISQIHFLKIDTQGFELEVLKGSKDMINSKAIKIIQLEITFNELYVGLPRFEELLSYLFACNYRLIAVYKFHNKNMEAQWTDALFISDRGI